MGTGIILVYVLIAALAAPFFWVVWWALDSFATRPARLLTAPAGVHPARSVEAFPRAADISLPIRRDAVTVYDRSGAEIATCLGPDASGRCPHTLADGTVPCAGNLLALPRAVRGSLEWQIPAGYRACVLGSYAAFRQPVAKP